MIEEKKLTQEEIEEALEHRDVLLALREILATQSGQMFFKYLFKHFEIGLLPEVGVEGTLLHDHIGFLRAGVSIFELASEANPQLSAGILADIKKEKYERLRRT
jgi:hypothetical protein